MDLWGMGYGAGKPWFGKQAPPVRDLLKVFLLVFKMGMNDNDINTWFEGEHRCPTQYIIRSQQDLPFPSLSGLP